MKTQKGQTKNAPSRRPSATGYDALVEKTYNVARRAAIKHQGCQAGKPWSKLPEAARVGWKAAVRFVIENRVRHNR